MSNVREPPGIKPREPDTIDHTKGEEPKRWIVVVGHHGHFCDDLLIRCLRQVFHYTKRNARTIAKIIIIPHVAVGVAQNLTRDWAETQTKVANDYCEAEQSTCTCRSSLRFEAIQIDVKGE